MRTITIRVPAADLGAEMAAMRKWLDGRPCEPSRFTSRRHGTVLTVCVEFNKDGDGEAFKAYKIMASGAARIACVFATIRSIIRERRPFCIIGS
jgi:hypothetical protein